MNTHRYPDTFVWNEIMDEWQQLRDAGLIQPSGTRTTGAGYL